MTSNGSQGDRPIPTGGLRIDGESISIETRHESCSYRVSGNGGKAGSNYDFTGKLPLFATDRGIVAREIKKAVKEGHAVTAETEAHGASEFKTYGPVLIGWAEHSRLHSVGKFGIGGLLGL